MATRSLGTLTVDLIARIGGFTQGLTKAERDTDKFRKNLEKKRKEIEKEFTQMNVALAAVFTGVSVAVAHAVRSAGEIATLSKIANTTTDEFQRWAVATDTVGIGQEKLSDQLKDFTEKVGEFQQSGGGGMKDFFEQIAPKIGITADAFRGLSGPQALQLYYDSLEKAGLNQQQMSFYLESMASDTTALIPLLANGGKGMRELGDMAQQAGSIMDTETIRAAQELQGVLGVLLQRGEGLRNQFVSALLPTLVDIAGGMGDVTTQTTIAEDAGRAFGNLLRWVAMTAVGAVSAINLLGKAIGGAFAIADAAGVEGMSPMELLTDPGKSWENSKKIFEILTNQSEHVKAVVNDVASDLSRTAEEAGRVLENLAQAGSGEYQSGMLDRIKGIIDAQNELRKALSGSGVTGSGGANPAAAKAAKDALREQQQQLETAKRYLITLQDQVLQVEQLNNYQRLHHDIQRGALTLTEDQLRTAEGLATVLDMRAERGRDIETSLNRQNAELAAQRQLQALVMGYDADIAGMSMGDRAREEMEQRLQLEQQFADRVQQIEDQRRQALAQSDESEHERITKMYDDVLKIEQDFQNKSLEAFERHQQQKREKEGNWLAGATSAMETWAEQTRNVYQQARDVMTEALTGASEQLTNMIVKGQADLEGFLSSLLQQLIQLEMQALMTNIAMRATGDNLGGSGGDVFGLLGSMLGLGGGAAGGVADAAGAAGEAAASAALATAKTAETTATIAATTALTTFTATLAAASASQSADSAMGFLTMFGFADGGYTGPGGVYEPAGLVHKGEGVLSQRDMAAIGGPMGFERLRRAIHNGFANGGVVAPGAVRVPVPERGIPESGSGTTVDNRIALNLIDDPDRIASVLASKQGEKALTVLISRNPTKFRQLLGVR